MLAARVASTGVHELGVETALEPSMRPTLAATIALLLLVGVGMAEAAESTLFAETGGFLLG
jgi:hypothetical protein